jgi:hypothetical protein
MIREPNTYHIKTPGGLAGGFDETRQSAYAL